MRHLVLVVSLFLFAGCFVRATPYSGYQPVPSGERSEVYYYGNHFIPESAGGGWCYIDGPHQHDYFPERDDYYDYDQGYYWYRGPFLFSFFGGHPLPGGGWCFINGPHQHDYHPPSGAEWRWNRTGYVYQGQFRPERPPPASYWSRPAPRQDWRSNRPTVRPAPAPVRRPARDAVRPAPAPAPDRSVRPEPRREEERRAAPSDNGWPGRSGAAPGHGANLPPGQGGIAPGQERRDEGRGRPEAAPPAREERRSPEPAAQPRPGNDDKAKREKEKKDKERKDDDDRGDQRGAPRRR